MGIKKAFRTIILMLICYGISGGVFSFFEKPAMALEWGDLVLEKTYESMKKAGVNKVLFPHWFHRIRYKCKACHSHIFKMKRGSNDINMGGIIQGKWCGNCHNGDIAFSPYLCDRCHSYAEKDLMASIEDALKNQESTSAGETELDGHAVLEESPVEEAGGTEDLTGGDEIIEEEEEEEEEEDSVFLRQVTLDPSSTIYLNSSGKLGSIGKPGTRVSKAAKLGALNKAQALKDLTADRFGLVDWVAAIKEQKIAPISGVSEFSKDRFEDYVQIFKAKSDFLEDVPFPHDIHTYNIDCDSCHPRPFISKAGKNPDVQMAEMKDGNWCGKCHGKVAFPLDDCKRCHSREGLKALQAEASN